MKRFLSAALLATAAFAFTACEDEPNAKPKVLPTEPAPMVSPMLALSGAPARLTGSSVCSSYLRERVRLTSQLVRAPKDTALNKRAQALASIITDACN